MGFAGLRFGPDGRVAWGEIWTSFCDLALAGGPPHRGSLLEPPPPEEVRADPNRYREVVIEIARGIWLTTGLPVLLEAAPGWVAVDCLSEEMAAWLCRAVIAENVFARQARHLLSLPAGPRYRLEKEIKNVVVTLAKTCHYWTRHMAASNQAEAASIMGGRPGGNALLEPATPEEARARSEDYRVAAQRTLHAVREVVGFSEVTSQSPGWVGWRCADEMMAAWIMRALIAENIVARREGDVLFLPVLLSHPEEEATGRMIDTLARIVRLWAFHASRKRLADG
jgi:hypothetical protein